MPYRAAKVLVEANISQAKSITTTSAADHEEYFPGIPQDSVSVDHDLFNISFFSNTGAQHDHDSAANFSSAPGFSPPVDVEMNISGHIPSSLAIMSHEAVYAQADPVAIARQTSRTKYQMFSDEIDAFLNQIGSGVDPSHALKSELFARISKVLESHDAAGPQTASFDYHQSHVVPDSYAQHCSNMYTGFGPATSARAATAPFSTFTTSNASDFHTASFGTIYNTTSATQCQNCCGQIGECGCFMEDDMTKYDCT